MQIRITNLTANDIGPIQGLPDGGIIDGPANTVSTFTLQGDEDFSAVEERLNELVAAGDIEFFVRADRNDHGARMYVERFRVLHSDLTAAAGTETLLDDYTFEDGAVLMGYRAELVAEFAGGAVNACTVDVGIGAGAEGDLLHDGLNVFTGAGTGLKHTSGANAIGRDRLDLGGKKLRVKVDSTNGNVADLTAGELLVEAYYIVI